MESGGVQRAFQAEDGEFYRVSQDEYGTQHSFRLLDGAAGSDYRTDARTGEQFVEEPDTEGTSRRVVIGRDAWVPLKHQVGQMVAGHRASLEDLQTTIHQAEEGTDGAPSLKELKAQASLAAGRMAPARKVMDKYQEDLAANPSAIFTPAQRAEYEAAEAVVARHSPTVDRLQGEIERRQGILDEAHQQRTAGTARLNDARQVATVLNSGDKGQRQGIVNDLLALQDGGNLDPKRMARFQAAGLVGEEGGLTEVGRGLLPRPKTMREPQMVNESTAARSFRAVKDASGREVDRYEDTPAPVNGEDNRQF